jgi:hypothetical protein
MALCRLIPAMSSAGWTLRLCGGDVNNNVDVCALMLYITPMSKTDTIGMRLEPDEKQALERAAKADDRKLSAIARMIVVAWLRDNGWLPVETMEGNKR